MVRGGEVLKKVKNGKLIKGIKRKRVIKILSEEGVSVKEKKIKIEDLREEEEIL